MERVEGYYGTEAEFATKGIAPRRRPERGQVKSDERLLGPFSILARRRGCQDARANGNNQQQNVIAAFHKKARKSWMGAVSVCKVRRKEQEKLKVHTCEYF